MVTSRTIRLDPRTNDPYFNEFGKLELASKQEALAQKFGILVGSNVGQCPLHYEYGLDYEWIKNNSTMTTEQALFMEITRKFEEGVEPGLYGFNIVDIFDDAIRKTVTIYVEVVGKDNTKATAEVSLA